MAEQRLEKRMYCIVPHNISEIQKGMQASHASLEYARKYGNTPLFKDFVDNDKTLILLDGGTTRYSLDDMGQMNRYEQVIRDCGLPYSIFIEPDLNYSLTAIAFIVDERVYNNKDYPHWNDFYYNLYGLRYNANISTFAEQHWDLYVQWSELVGGTINVAIKEIIRNMRLS